MLRYLTLGGFSVVDAESGPEALAILGSRSDVSLLVTDLNMPEMNGLELIARVKADPRWKALPILVLSVTGSPEIQAAVLEQGAVGFMQKPFSLPEFLERVQAFL
ncbi:MAG: response regulator [Candidatus Wallbacteria bacterium]|nr:response regulator [Candidatus Wallbacteria bacterium]